MIPENFNKLLIDINEVQVHSMQVNFLLHEGFTFMVDVLKQRARELRLT